MGRRANVCVCSQKLLAVLCLAGWVSCLLMCLESQLTCVTLLQ